MAKQMRFRRKPRPYRAVLCASELDVAPEECLFFGDSASDMQAAHNAGMEAVAVTWGYQPQERLMAAAPDHVIEKPVDMLRFIEQ